MCAVSLIYKLYILIISKFGKLHSDNNIKGERIVLCGFIVFIYVVFKGINFFLQ